MGSFTLSTISASAKTVSASGTMAAPARSNSASLMLEPSPAPRSIRTG
jgi:hypothetical protein